MNILAKFECDETPHSRCAIRPPIFLTRDVHCVENIDYTFTNHYSLPVHIGVTFRCTKASLPHATENAENQILTVLFEEQLALVRAAKTAAYEHDCQPVLSILNQLEASMLES